MTGPRGKVERGGDIAHLLVDDPPLRGYPRRDASDAEPASGDSPLAEDRENNDSDEPLTLGPGFVHFSGDVYLHTSRRPVSCWTKRHIFDLTFQLYGPDKVHYPFRDCDPTGKYTKGCEVEKLRSQIAVRRYLERAGDLKNLTETQIEELEERRNAAVAESRGLAMAKAKGVRVSQRSADVEEFNETNANAEEQKRAEVPEPEPTAEDAPKLSTTPPKYGRGRPKKKPRDALGRILRSTKGSSTVAAEAGPPAEPEACSVDCATLMAVVDWRSARMREEMRTMIEKASVDEMKQLAVIYGDALVKSTEITIAQAERVKALEADAVTVGEALEQAVAMKDEIGERAKGLEAEVAAMAAERDSMKTERDLMKTGRDELKDAMVKLAKALAFDSPLFKDVPPSHRWNADDMESDPLVVLSDCKRELVRIAPIWKTGKDKAKAELKKVKAELKRVKAEGFREYGGGYVANVV